ncbi:MAG: AsmA-like C-terminal domain-containing protein [Desulfosarcina sp.]|nr:AsmA-like C-terminal domain-containing protein [Desulfobacterales bacterium]
MPISSNLKRILAVAAVLTLLMGSIVILVVPVMLERWLNQYDLQSAFHKATGGSISTGAIHLRLFPAPHLIVPAGKLEIPKLVCGSWREIRIHPALKPILSGQIRFRQIKILGPDVQLAATIAREAEGAAKVDATQLTAEHLRALLTGMSHRMGSGMQWLMAHAPESRVRIRDGRLGLGADRSSRSLSFHDIDARLTLPPQKLHIELDCQSNIGRTLRLNGTVDANTLTGQLILWFTDLNTEVLTDTMGLNRLLDRAEGLLSGQMTLNLQGPSKVESRLFFRLPQLVLQRLEKPLTVQNILVDGNLVIDETMLKFDLARLQADHPRLNLTGHVQIGGDVPGMRIHLVGAQIDVAEARQATLALVGDDEIAAGIFDVLRAGHVPWVSWRTEGPTVGDLGVFRNMTLTAEMQAGELFIPGADLPLTEVNGIADISGGVLKGENLEARYLTTTGRGGRLWLDLDQDEIPFFLEIDTHLEDAGLLPPLLIRWVDDNQFRNELRRLGQVRGEVRGTMIIDSRQGDFEVTVDVSQCRLAAHYDRLPWEVQIDEGQVQYTGDRIAVDQMKGRIGSSTFSTLKAHIDFGHESLLHIDSLRAMVDLKTIIPRLASLETLAPVAHQYRAAGGKADITRLKLHGPFFKPARWAYDLKGRIDRLRLEADTLPGPLQFSDIRWTADEKTLIVESTALKALDADLTVGGRAAIQNGRLQSYSINLKGAMGAITDKWINDLYEAEEDLFLMQTPLEISAVTIDWVVDNPFVLTAEFTTSGGVHVSMAHEWQPGVFQKGRFSLVDGDARATISLHQESDQLALAFEGALFGKTLSRLLLRNPFPSGRLKGDFRAVIVPGQPARSTASGHLAATNIRLPLNMDQKIHIGQLQLSAEDNRLRITPAAFLIDDNWHTLEGDVIFASDSYHVDLKHDGAYLELPSSEETQAEGEDSGLNQLLNLPINGKIQSRFSLLKIGDRSWIPMKTTILLAPGQWRIQLEEAERCGIQTTGSIRLEPEKTSIDLILHARDKPLKSTLSCLLGRSDLVDGRFSLEGHITDEAPSKEIGQSLDGQFEFEAQDGRIHRFDLLGRILSVINLTELVRGKKSDLMGEGLAYRKIEIEGNLKNNRLTLDKALIDGASVEIAAKGSLDLKDDEIDLIVLVAPLKTVDALVKFTPIVNTWLEGTLVSIPVRVSGDIDDPRITPMSPTAVGSSLFNLLKNTVQLPIKLVKPLFENEDDDGDKK